MQGLNPYAAYEFAGFKPSKGAPYRLRENARISARINELRSKLIRKVERSLDMTVDRLTREFARIGLANVTDVLAIKDGQVIVQDTAQIGENTAAAIGEIRQTKDGIVVKMHNKTQALENLAKHMGYYKENFQLNVTMSLAELVNMSYQQDLPELPAPKVREHEKE